MGLTKKQIKKIITEIKDDLNKKNKSKVMSQDEQIIFIINSWEYYK